MAEEGRCQALFLVTGRVRAMMRRNTSANRGIGTRPRVDAANHVGQAGGPGGHRGRTPPPGGTAWTAPGCGTRTTLKWHSSFTAVATTFHAVATKKRVR